MELCLVLFIYTSVQESLLTIANTKTNICFEVRIPREESQDRTEVHVPNAQSGKSNVLKRSHRASLLCLARASWCMQPLLLVCISSLQTKLILMVFPTGLSTGFAMENIMLSWCPERTGHNMGDAKANGE